MGRYILKIQKWGCFLEKRKEEKKEFIIMLINFLTIARELWWSKVQQELLTWSKKKQEAVEDGVRGGNADKSGIQKKEHKKREEKIENLSAGSITRGGQMWICVWQEVCNAHAVMCQLQQHPRVDWYSRSLGFSKSEWKPSGTCLFYLGPSFSSFLPNSQKPQHGIN